MGKVLAIVALAALSCGAFLFPIAGRTAWQRAQDRGLPGATLRAVSHGAHAAWDWAAHGFHASREGTQPPPLHSRATRQLAQAHLTAPSAPVHAAGRDHVVAAPPAEHLSGSDRKALDALVTSR